MPPSTTYSARLSDCFPLSSAYTVKTLIVGVSPPSPVNARKNLAKDFDLLASGIASLSADMVHFG